MGKLDQRIALISGAGRGIGRAIAEQFASEGATVLCVSKTPANCQQVAQDIINKGGKAEAFPMDVADKNSIASVSEEILKKYACVDILVNNAGITRDKLFVRMDDTDWEQVLLTNLFSAFYLCKQFVRPMTMKRWGRIINMASVSGIMGNAGQANYSAAKAGLIGFTKTLAKELACRSITVNAIAPGFIATNMTKDLPETVVEQAKKVIPLKRFGEAEDVANVATFLASEAASYITGQVLKVDGGMVM
ncbi:MAG: 3-oxoacyl-[acyl-carrier-protein] reductase [bacterium]